MPLDFGDLERVEHARERFGAEFRHQLEEGEFSQRFGGVGDSGLVVCVLAPDGEDLLQERFVRDAGDAHIIEGEEAVEVVREYLCDRRIPLEDLLTNVYMKLINSVHARVVVPRSRLFVVLREEGDGRRDVELERVHIELERVHARLLAALCGLANDPIPPWDQVTARS